MSAFDPKRTSNIVFDGGTRSLQATTRPNASASTRPDRVPSTRFAFIPISVIVASVSLMQSSSAQEVERRGRVLTEQQQQLQVEKWNQILTAPRPRFNTKPNAFLVAMTRGMRPGRALDVGMGQGRNALYLARQGWAVTGFDPAYRAVAVAQEQARRLGVKLTAMAVRDDQFDFGEEQWDLIVLSYVRLRHLVPRICDALSPGGLVVVEAFHRDATKNDRIGAGVVFDTNELPRLFERLRVVRYEEADDIADFGLEPARLVRFAAQKP